jgi:membrane protein
MSPKGAFVLFKAAGSAWSRDNAARLGAALSYYAIFAIPQLIIIVMFVAGLCLNSVSVSHGIHSQLADLLGDKGAATIEGALTSSRAHTAGMVATVLAIGGLILTASGLFIELQGDLNALWDVEPKPGLGVGRYLKNRLSSFLMVLAIGVLLVLSLVVSAWLAAGVKYLNAHIHGLGFASLLVNDLLSFAIVTVLFAMIFKILPDMKIAWRDVWAGAATTSFLFAVGKILLGLYLAKNATVSAYGAAGSVILILLWIYYSAQILFFGAELTRVRAKQFGRRLQPKAHAQWRIHEDHSVPDVAGALPERAKRARKDEGRGRKGRRVLALRAEVEQLRGIVQANARRH